MALRQFRYLKVECELYVGDQRIPGIDSTEWFASLETVGEASLASLRRAFSAAANNYDGTNRFNNWGLRESSAILQVSSAPAEDFDEDYSIGEPIELGLADGRLVLDTLIQLHGSGLEEDDLEPFLRPLLERARARFLGAGLEGSGNQAYATVRVELMRRGATVNDGVNLGDDIRELLNRVRDRDLTAESALDLIRANRADLLIGLPESPWLEAKSRGYDLSGDAGRIEFAQDVARFANSDSSGLLVVGLTTRKTHGQEIIRSVHPAESRFDSARHHRALDEKVFPPIQGLTIESIAVRTLDGRAGHLLAVFVPAQPEEAKPVLVHGAIVRGRVEGAFISIIQRRGEHSVPVRPESIHATLVAGRALLRRGQIPN